MNEEGFHRDGHIRMRQSIFYDTIAHVILMMSMIQKNVSDIAQLNILQSDEIMSNLIL